MIASWDSDTRNVIDRYKGLPDEVIRADIDTRRVSLVYVLENLQGDFNFSNIIRTCNAFACSGIIFFGKRRYDRRGAVGTQNYENIWHTDSLEQLLEWTHFSRRVAAEIGPKVTNNLYNYQWEKSTTLFLGEEGPGLSDKLVDVCDDVVEIPQRGSVRSMNVANVAGIMTYDYFLKTNQYE